MRLKTFFYGGMELDGNKVRTMRVPIANAALPNVAIVPLLQYDGAEAEALVAAGETVGENACIGRSPEGAAIHSPIPGLVRELRDIRRPDGRVTRAVVIEMAGSFDRTGRTHQPHDWTRLGPEELLGIICNMGVSGLGNTALPTHLKLGARRLPEGPGRARYLVINAMESEPYLTADYRILMEKTAAVLEGVRIAQHILGLDSAVLALSSEYRDAAPAVRKAVGVSAVKLSVQVLPAIFPQGDDRLLSQTLFRTDQPRTGPDGCGEMVVLSVSTVLAIQEAVVLRKPLTERVVTISGGAIRQALNLRVRIGTPISWLLEECGGLNSLPDRIVVGGPLTGKTIVDPDTPVTKETRGILVLERSEINYAPRRDCLRCGACIRICPSGLEPVRLYKLIRAEASERALREDLALCTECGLCSHACPSHLPLVRQLREGKARLAATP
jgi:electron transport complex protein RnfC